MGLFEYRNLRLKKKNGINTYTRSFLKFTLNHFSRCPNMERTQHAGYGVIYGHESPFYRPFKHSDSDLNDE